MFRYTWNSLQISNILIRFLVEGTLPSPTEASTRPTIPTIPTNESPTPVQPTDGGPV